MICLNWYAMKLLNLTMIGFILNNIVVKDYQCVHLTTLKNLLKYKYSAIN